MASRVEQGAGRHLFGGDLDSACDVCGLPLETKDERHDFGKVVNPITQEIRPYLATDADRERRQMGEQEFLARYDASGFARSATAVDVVVLTIRKDEMCALLVKRAEPPFRGRWALPGTFVRPDEDAAQAALRALQTKTGIVDHLEQLGTYSEPDRDPRMRVISIAYLAFGLALDDPEAGVNVDAAEWWPVSKVGTDFGGKIDRRTLAFDHAQIMWDGVERARSKIEYTSLATKFLPETFTIPDLRRVYEIVWGREVDRGNFHRKVRSSVDFLVKTGEQTRRGLLYRSGSPRLLYPPIRRDSGTW